MEVFAVYLSILSLIFALGSVGFAIYAMRQHKREYYRKQGWPDPYRRS
jgi:hypothetical protein